MLADVVRAGICRGRTPSAFSPFVALDRGEAACDEVARLIPLHGGARCITVAPHGAAQPSGSLWMSMSATALGQMWPRLNVSCGSPRTPTISSPRRANLEAAQRLAQVAGAIGGRGLGGWEYRAPWTLRTQDKPSAGQA